MSTDKAPLHEAVREPKRPDEWVPEEPAADLQKAGESMTFAECDDMLDCITRILDKHRLNGATHCHMMRWKFRQLEAAAQQERARLAELEAWAKRERDDWSERNADRYWQMNRVVQAIGQITSGVASHLPPTPEEDELSDGEIRRRMKANAASHPPPTPEDR